MLYIIVVLIVLVGVNANVGVLSFRPGRVSETFATLPDNTDSVDGSDLTDTDRKPSQIVVIRTAGTDNPVFDEEDENPLVDDIGTIGINNGLIKEYNYKQKYGRKRPYYPYIRDTMDDGEEQQDIGEIGINNGVITEYNFKQQHRRHRRPHYAHRRPHPPRF